MERVCVCAVLTQCCVYARCYRYFKHTFLDGKSCSWKTICNHNKGSGWPEEMLTVAEFFTPISVYIKRVCVVHFIYKLTWSPSQEVYYLGLAQKDADCGTDGNGWKTHRRRDSDCHKPTVLIPTRIVSHLTPAPAGIKQPCSTPTASCPRKSPGEQEWWDRQFWGCLCSTHMCVLSQHQPNLLPLPQGSAATNPPVQLPYMHLLRERVL